MNLKKVLKKNILKKNILLTSINVVTYSGTAVVYFNQSNEEKNALYTWFLYSITYMYIDK